MKQYQLNSLLLQIADYEESDFEFLMHYFKFRYGIIAGRA
jgi:hypothetical protein